MGDPAERRPPLRDILAGLKVRSVTGPLPRLVTGVVADSRRVRGGDLFVAVPGRRVDGGVYADEAVKRGAVAVVAEGWLPLDRSVALIQVPDAREALARLAAAVAGHPAHGMRMIGITGTKGKTTTSFLIHHVLQAAGHKAGLIGTVHARYGARILPAILTTPDAADLHPLLADMRREGCTHVVMEVSAHALDQKRVLGIRFEQTLFTNLGLDHLDYFPSPQAYYEAKRSLLIQAGRRGTHTRIINRDDVWGRKLAEETRDYGIGLEYGLEGGEVRAREIEPTREGVSFLVTTPWGGTRMRLPLLGRHNVSNALAAIASLGALNLDLETIRQALADVPGVPGRLERVASEGGVEVMVDYAHTEDALASALEAARTSTDGRLILVVGCGGDRFREKRGPMGRAAAEGSDLAVLTSDNPRTEDPMAILRDMKAGVPEGAAIEIIPDRREAIAFALRAARPGDTVLIAGKGHETVQIIGNTAAPFDDREVARDLLRETRP